MARGTGRPMAVLVLSDEEWSYLEGQVRRRQVARSISDRCRMILRCADGLTNKAVAAEMGVHEHTVGKWRRRFLKEIDRRVPDELDIHIVMDNYATHKTAAVKAWLARRPHWHVHFTPTSASWINQVERWFAELTRKQLQRGVHTSTRQLEADIRAFIEKHNEDPKPFRWTKSADDILAAVKRFCLRVDQNLCHEL